MTGKLPFHGNDMLILPVIKQKAEIYVIHKYFMDPLFGTNGCSKSTWKLIDFEFQEESLAAEWWRGAISKQWGWSVQMAACKTPFIGSELCTQIEKFCSKPLLHGSIFPWAAFVQPPTEAIGTPSSNRCGTSQFRSQRWCAAFGLAQVEMKKNIYAPGTSVFLTDVQWLADVERGHEGSIGKHGAISGKWPSENTGGKLPWSWKKCMIPGKYHPKMVDFSLPCSFTGKSDILGQFQVGRIANRKTDLLFMGFAEDG